MKTYKKGDGLKAIIIATTSEARDLAIQLYKEFLMFKRKIYKNSAKAKFQKKVTSESTYDV